MKTKALFLVILIATSCINKNRIDHFSMKKELNSHQVNTQIDFQSDLSPSDSIKQEFLNTQNNIGSPIKIISSKLLKNQYSDHKDIKLVYKNVSKKKIGAIRFEWYCENAFNKPASGKFFFIKGKSEGTTHLAINSRQTRSQIWESFSTDAKTIISARAYFVAFSDGTTWKLH
ncbi:hypothetical protein [Flavobacterium sp. LC2016-12]|uniref:hypothetical protein n=1 Tax=Flavobacterium sp. LC2016-12 TaxID=2783794 RepID=UPI00188ADA25|nr:hypothetical protein [Flavobacterium sp. LC2016-12]MBF4467305.1 hypothetical protein [Flavobacterium sp. LC2016-12]